MATSITTNSPVVKFNVVNNNTFPSTPIMGLSHVVAVTEKGPVGTANDIIRNFRQFTEIYGSETVPDGSVSNIQMALQMGSSLRISRVKDGGEATSGAWIEAMNVFKNYDDAYQMFCSHIGQHLELIEEEKVHIAAATLVKKMQSVVYYIEVPKYSDDAEETPVPNDKANMLSWVKALKGKLTDISEYIAFFGGGWKYYDQNGEMQDCDSLGTVVGLGDASAKNYGPWYQFSGMNRGLVSTSKGPVIPNYGSIGNYDELNELANEQINVSVIKDTSTMGKQPMLWHNFTCVQEDNSFKFLGVVRLVLYLKKNLKPLLDKYLEEPNTFATWSNIYYEVKPIFEELVNENAITEWNWYGDQDATNYDELSVNTEEEVRAGKYKAQFKFKEVIGMQEITVDLIIDKTNSSVTI